MKKYLKRDIWLRRVTNKKYITEDDFSAYLEIHPDEVMIEIGTKSNYDESRIKIYTNAMGVHELAEIFSAWSNKIKEENGTNK